LDRKKNSKQNITCHHSFRRYEKQPALSTITEHEEIAEDAEDAENTA